MMGEAEEGIEEEFFVRFVKIMVDIRERRKMCPFRIESHLKLKYSILRQHIMVEKAGLIVKASEQIQY